MMCRTDGNYSIFIPTNTTHSYLDDVPHEDPIVIINVSFDAILGCIVVCGNLLILAILLRGKPQSNTTNILVASLALADLLVWLRFIPTSIYRKITHLNKTFSYILCSVLPEIWGLTAIASILSMVGIGVER